MTWTNLQLENALPSLQILLAPHVCTAGENPSIINPIRTIVKKVNKSLYMTEAVKVRRWYQEPPPLPPQTKSNAKSKLNCYFHEIIMHGKHNSCHVQAHNLAINILCNMPSQYFEPCELS